MDIMFTITGIDYYYDTDELTVNQEIILRKEPTNKIDGEAIAVYTQDFKKIGYIANSVRTVAKGSYSAGRLYDKISFEESARILLVIHHSAIGMISLKNEE